MEKQFKKGVQPTGGDLSTSENLREFTVVVVVALIVIAIAQQVFHINVTM